MVTITFEDHGQDFLEWDIEGGKVVECRPFQNQIWKGTMVFNRNIQVGDKLFIITPDDFPPKNESAMTTLKYPVEKIEISNKNQD